MGNNTKAIVASVMSADTWVEAGAITVGWAVCFLLFAMSSLVAGSALVAVIRYFIASMSCGVASAIIVSVAHGAIVNYRHIIARKQMEETRRRRRQLRRRA